MGYYMYENIKALGIDDTDSIESYNLRSESEFDILKIYHKKAKGEFFARSEKFKFPRQHKRVRYDKNGREDYQNVSEISPTLRYIVDDLDQICKKEAVQLDVKKKILKDLRHLERVVANKIAEIEADLERL